MSELEEQVKGFLNRDDVAILLIVQYVADMVRHIIENYTKLTPAILEIPSKEHAYDPSKDFILKRAQVCYLLRLIQVKTQSRHYKRGNLLNIYVTPFTNSLFCLDFLT